MTAPRLFVVYTRDRAGATDIRAAQREGHLAFMRSLGAQAKLGGPLMAADGQARIGGIYVLEAADLAQAQAIAARDPYVQAGLFDVMHVDEWRWQTRNL